MEPISIDTMMTVFNVLLTSQGNYIQLNSKDIDVSPFMRIGGGDNVRQTCDIQEMRNLSDIVTAALDYQTEANNRLESIIHDIKAIKTYLSTTNSVLCSQRLFGEIAITLPQLPLPLSVWCVNNKYGDNWLLIAHRKVSTAMFRSAMTPDKEDNGIGEFQDEYFIGFKKLHAITDSQMCELLIVETDGKKNQWYDHYKTVAFGANNKVKLLGKHSSNRADNSIGLLAHAEAVNQKLKLHLNPNTDITIYLRQTSLHDVPVFKDT